jgi:hypothetical protein
MPTRPTGSIAPPPNGPEVATHSRATGLTAVVVAAKASIASVVELHDIAVSAGQRGRIPATAIPTSAKAVETQLKLQADTVTKLKSAKSGPPAQLASALDQYALLADTLARWNAHRDAKLAPAFFTRLEAADAGWKAAMRAVGKLANQQLLANVPKLLLPA